MNVEQQPYRLYLEPIQVLICQLKPIFAPILFRIASYRPHDSCHPTASHSASATDFLRKRWPWRPPGHTLLILGRSHISSNINQTISPHPPSSPLSEPRQVSNSGMSESSYVASSREQPSQSVLGCYRPFCSGRCLNGRLPNDI